MLLVCIGGALPAPPLALFMGWLLDIRWEEIFIRPEILNRYAWLSGACQALCVYLFGVLPLEYLRPRLRQFSKSVIYATALAGALLGASLGSLLASSKVNLLLGLLLGSGRVLRAQPPRGRLLALSFVITIGAGLLMLLVRTVLAEAENRELALAEAAALAKAHALQSQINPHFFFNTLTTVSALAELDSRAARELVGQLAQLFRYTLSCSRFELVTMAQELEFVANYLLIEQARFRRRLHFEMPPAGAGRDVLLPGLTLQPLVENAIRHGIAKRREGGLIKVALDRLAASPTRLDGGGRGSVWILSVANQIEFSDGPPSFEREKFFRPGHSLANTRDRLALAFHGRATLDFLYEEGGWVKVVVTLPAS
jgi:LytS/YehU family sensor histidine kinase